MDTKKIAFSKTTNSATLEQHDTKKKTPTFVYLRRCKLDPEVREHLLKNSFDLTMREGYPWIIKADRTLVEVLHEFVWRFFNPSRPIPPGHVIHHKNVNPLDARNANLELMDRSRHRLIHNRIGQKFSPRKRLSPAGIPFRPRPPKPTPTAREDLLAWAATLPLPASAPRERPADPLEEKLAASYFALADELRGLDSGTRIPPNLAAKTRTKKEKNRDRKMGIGRVRLGCTPGEAAFVLLWIKHRGDVGSASLEVGVPEPSLRRMLELPSVSMAMMRWREFRRLPAVGRQFKQRVWAAMAPRPDPAG